MSVSICKLHSRASILSAHVRSSDRKDQQRRTLLDDVASSLEDIAPKSSDVLSEPISRIKLSGNYSRKLVVKAFSELGLTVTRYTREYGKTIVHFDDASNSQ